MAQLDARKKLIRLIQKYLAGKASPAEEEFLDAYYKSFDGGEEKGSQDDAEKEALRQEMKTAIWQQIHTSEEPPAAAPMIKRIWFQIAMAAAIVVLAFIPVYYFSIRTPTEKIVQTNQLPAPAVNDAMPGSNKATLTLADGTVIDLDKAANGTIATVGKTIVKKKEDGSLAYQHAHASLPNDHSPAYNMLSTPKGGQYFLELPDGSKVWLNAASSIRYPTAFTGKERLVELTGEAYFDIKKNHAKPFRVHFSSSSTGARGREGLIEVLGTQFNVNAYEDERTIRTTLLEGKVRQWVMPADKQMPDVKNAVVLNPGQQAQLSNTALGKGHIRVIDDVDLEEAIAWKNGLFYFNNVDIQAIMRQLARWYKVQVVFKGRIPARRFAGQVSRNSNLSQVLKILELSKIHFTIEGTTVTVLP
ncbi:FecR family protein [Longitalea luteola]|uniref:FecR family protein n=1 Tax=Longitalea luteola TaxID=2812563 RepID=UPI001A968020|nr:FecR family protein [Longitalea luteola]